jgi:hypothetical protein
MACPPDVSSAVFGDRLSPIDDILATPPGTFDRGRRTHGEALAGRRPPEAP